MSYLRTPGRGGGRRVVRSGRGPPLPSVAHSALPAISDSASSRFESCSSSRLFARALETTASATWPARKVWRYAWHPAALRSIRCWVVPGRDSSSSAGSVRRVPSLHSAVSLRLVYTWPLFLHTSAGVNPAGSVPGSQEAAVPAAGADSVGISLRSTRHRLRRSDSARLRLERSAPIRAVSRSGSGR